MADDCYAKIEGGLFGPMSPAKLKQLAEQGQINADTPICRGEDGKWLEARRVKGLQPYFDSPQNSETSPQTVTVVPRVEDFEDSQNPSRLSGRFPVPLWVVSALAVALLTLIAAWLVWPENTGTQLANPSKSEPVEDVDQKAVVVVSEEEMILNRFETLLSRIKKKNRETTDSGGPDRMRDLKFDVKRTDSLTSPFTATANFRTPYLDGKEYILNYVFQDEKWTLKSVLQKYDHPDAHLGGVHPKGWHKPASFDLPVSIRSWDETSSFYLDSDMFSDK